MCWQGFAFLKYADQRSTILAVDNLNNATVFLMSQHLVCLLTIFGLQILGRTVRVDHVDKYKQPTEDDDDDENKKKVDFLFHETAVSILDSVIHSPWL